MNPFDLPGPEFLLLFLALFAGAVGLGSYLRASLRKSRAPALEGVPQLDPYETAFLAGGHPRAVEAAVAELAHRGILTADPAGRRIRTASEAPAALHPLEAAVLRVVGSSGEVSLDRLIAGLEPDTWALRRSLEQQALLLTDEERGATRWKPALPLLALTLFGVIKIALGVSRERPVAFLVMLCLFSFVGAVLFLCIRSTRTRYGDAVIERLTRRNKALRLNAGSSLATLGQSDVGRAVALFGVGVLAVGPLSDVAATLRPQNTGGGGNGCGAGGGSCGGGGGGGGGGCGGCGGG